MLHCAGTMGGYQGPNARARASHEIEGLNHAEPWRKRERRVSCGWGSLSLLCNETTVTGASHVAADWFHSKQRQNKACGESGFLFFPVRFGFCRKGRGFAGGRGLVIVCAGRCRCTHKHVMCIRQFHPCFQPGQRARAREP